MSLRPEAGWPENGCRGIIRATKTMTHIRRAKAQLKLDLADARKTAAERAAAPPVQRPRAGDDWVIRTPAQWDVQRDLKEHPL